MLLQILFGLSREFFCRLSTRSYSLHFVVSSSAIAGETVSMGLQGIDDIEKSAGSGFTSPAATIDAMGMQAADTSEIQKAICVYSPRCGTRPGTARVQTYLEAERRPTALQRITTALRARLSRPQNDREQPIKIRSCEWMFLGHDTAQPIDISDSVRLQIGIPQFSHIQEQQ
jgi:hypothetical protein